ncbi:N-acyl homoserine lactonase family protein [uncultured Oscillibacter sp.]|uniref:N-acyl homoserine lactonase family protein n=1 Tax=uncultured Oscillibacter sp. TaxID=876091 RepID=UPI0025D2DA14|nr:N-acyl homoserine lactonase family protein [uncultured Oscillibacter sp.]
MNKNANYGAGKWKATVLSCGTHMNYKGALSSGYDQELFIKLPYLAYLLQDGEMNILIDNGINERYVVDGKAWGGIPAWASSKDLLDSLAKHGLGPGDIDLVLYTHLHNDHAGNANLFPTTRSIAQKDEWENLLAPTYAELQRRDFDLDVVPYLKDNPNFIKIDGDLEIMEGIRLVKTPGHTRGSQSIVVNTTQGLRIFVGDLFHMPCCCFPWMTEMPDCDGVMHKITPAADNAPSLRSSLVYDCYSYYESVDKIKALLPAMDPAYVVCGHDPALFPRS